MACTFCATGWAGYRRQLSAGEIVAQFRGARRWAQENGYDDVTNIVFMGMGEPLMNPKAVFPTLAILNRGYRFGARRITISTVGLVPAIERFAAEHRQVNLAVSLHAATDELRTEMLPINKKYPLAVLFDAVRKYYDATRRRVVAR